MTAVIDRPAGPEQHFTNVDAGMRPPVAEGDMPLTPPMAETAWVEPVTPSVEPEAPIIFDIPGLPEADQNKEQPSPLRTKAANAIKGLLRRNRSTAEDEDAPEEPTDEDYSHLPPPPPPPPAGGRSRDSEPQPEPFDEDFTDMQRMFGLDVQSNSLPAHLPVKAVRYGYGLNHGFETEGDEPAPHVRKIARYKPMTDKDGNRTGKITRYPMDDITRPNTQKRHNELQNRAIEKMTAMSNLPTYKKTRIRGVNATDIGDMVSTPPVAPEEQPVAQPQPRMSRRAQEYADRTNPTTHQGDIESIVQDIADDAELSFPEWINAGSPVAPEFMEFVSDDDDLDVPDFVRPTGTEATTDNDDLESVDVPTDDRLSKAIAAAVRRAAQSVFDGRTEEVAAQEAAEEEPASEEEEAEATASILERVKKDARVEKAVRVAGAAAVVGAAVGLAVLRSRKRR